MKWSPSALTQLMFAKQMGQNVRMIKREAEELAKRDEADRVYGTHVRYVREGLK